MVGRPTSGLEVPISERSARSIFRRGGRLPAADQRVAELRALTSVANLEGTLDIATESSQLRVAKMEAVDPSVSIDLLIRSLLALGVSREEVAESIRRAA